MIEVLTAVLAIATLTYTWLTYQILKANQQNVDVMRDQAMALTRPYVAVFATPEPETPLFSLKIRNVGNSCARNLRLTMDRSFYQYGKADEKHDISLFNAFREPIQAFAPGSEISFYLAQSFKVFADDADAAVTPTRFSVTATYEFADRKVHETSTVDLEPYRNSAIQIDRRLEKLTKALDEIPKAIQKASGVS